jgi:hypothetical protein
MVTASNIGKCEQMLEKAYAKILLKSGTSLSEGETKKGIAALQHSWVANYSRGMFVGETRDVSVP